jgi:hypothetical protein
MNKNEIQVNIGNVALLAWTIYKFGDKVQGDTGEITTSADKKRLLLYKKLFSVWDEVNKEFIEPSVWVGVKSAYNNIGVELRRRSMPVFTIRNGVKRMRRGLRLVLRAAIAYL